MISGKRILTFFLAVVMVVSMLPVHAFAVNTEAKESQENLQNEEVVVASEETTTLEALDGGALLTYNGTVEDGTVIWDDDINGWDYFRLNHSGPDYLYDEVVVANTTSDKVLSFTYSIATGIEDFKVDGVAPSGASIVVNPKSSITISFKIAADEYIGGQFYLTDLTLQEATESGVTFVYDTNYGQVTMTAGETTTTLEPNKPYTIPATGVTLTATPKNSAEFLGWVNGTDNARIPGGSSLEFTPSGQTAINVAFTHKDALAWFRSTDSTYLYDLHAAIQAANATENEMTVILAADGTLTGSYKIPKNLNVVVPYAQNDNGTFSEEPGLSEDRFGSTAAGRSQYAFRTLTLGSDTTVECEGKINVNGQVYEYAGMYTGVPTGPYGLIKLSDKTSKIILVDGEDADTAAGSLYCYGYITGAGEVVAESGTEVYEVFQISGWRAGSAVSDWASKAGVTWGSSSDIKNFAFADYAVQNVEANMTVKSGATSYAVATVTVSSLTRRACVKYTGTEESFIQLGSGAAVSRRYNTGTNRIEYTLCGNVTIAGIDVTVTTTGRDTLTLNSAKHILALNSYMDFIVTDGTLTLQNDYKMLPGATLTITETGNVVVAGNLYLYDTADYVDKGYVTQDATLNSVPVGYVATTNTTTDVRQTIKGIPQINAATPSAQVTVNGTLQVDGGLFTTSNGGTSSDKVLKGTGTFINNSAATGIVTNVLDEMTTTENTVLGYTTGYTVHDVNITVTPVVGRIAGLSTGDEYHVLSGKTYKGTEVGYWYEHAITANNPQYVEKARTAATVDETEVEGTVGVVGNGKKITYSSGKASSLPDASGVFKFHLNTNGTVTYGEGTVLTPSESGLYTLTDVTGQTALQIDATGASNKSEVSDYQGKVISILGDDASAYAGTLPVADGFNKEHAAKYTEADFAVTEMWWNQLLTTLGAKMGVNDSWAGSQVANTIDGNSGSLGVDAAMASMTRIQNLGSNGTPDVIIFFGGTNDILNGVNLTAFAPDNAPRNVDKTATRWDSFTDAYIAAIMRLKSEYPNSKIMAVLPAFNNAKLAQYSAVMQDICDHYGVRTVDLRDSGLTGSVCPDEAGMDKIEEYILANLLRNFDVEPGENKVHSVIHNLSVAEASKGYYKGVSYGASFSETITGKELENVTVTMGGTDVTADMYSAETGMITIAQVTGDLVISASAKFDYKDFLQPLPTDAHNTMNLWQVLDPDFAYYNGKDWVTEGNIHSVIVPIAPGDELYATSFGAKGENGGSKNGIPVTWFFADGASKTMGSDEVYREVWKYGCLTAPENAVAVCVPMWNNGSENVFNILTLPANYSSLYKQYLREIPENAYRTTNLWDPEKIVKGYFNDKRVFGYNGEVHSITVPISAGDKIASESFGASSGIRMTWFDENGVLETLGGAAVKEQYTKNGYLVAPEGAVAVNVPSWTSENEFYILTLPRDPNVPINKSRYEKNLRELPDPAYSDTNLWTEAMVAKERYKNGNWESGYWSVTMEVTPGDKIDATSFSADGGIRITWFLDDGDYLNVEGSDVAKEYKDNGYLTAPYNAVAVNIPMWTTDYNNELYNLSLPDRPLDVIDESIYLEYLQELPGEAYNTTNLWTTMEPDNVRYKNGEYIFGAQSLTVPVNPGDQLWATSFGAKATYGGDDNGIRVTWFLEGGRVLTMEPDEVYAEFTKNGFVTAPDGVVAVNVPMWDTTSPKQFRILTLPDDPNRDSRFEGKVVSIMGDSISTFAGLIPVDDGFNLAHRARYPDSGNYHLEFNDLRNVEETWWHQVITELGAQLGINDSWAGSTVTNVYETNDEYGDRGPDKAMASMTRILNLGANGTPDVILVFGGTNDSGYTWGTFDPNAAPTAANVSLTDYKWDTVTEAFAVMLARMQHFYPNAKIVALLPYNTGMAKNSELKKICDHYDVPYADLWDAGIRVDGGYNEVIYDGIHPTVKTMDVITDAVMETVLNQVSMEPGAQTVYKVTHNLVNSTASKHYYKGVSGGAAFEETIKATSVTVTMGGSDVTAKYYNNGVLSIPKVTGDLVITADSRLQEMPEGVYRDTNLWGKLNVRNEYYNGSRWTTGIRSVTFSVTPGDTIWATSFGEAATNGSASGNSNGQDGIRVTWLDENGNVYTLNGSPSTWSPGTVYSTLKAEGDKQYLVVPTGAAYVNVPVWGGVAEPELYVYTLPTIYDAHLVKDMPTDICGNTDLWDLLKNQADTEYFTENKVWGSGLRSLTIPVKPDDHVWSSAFGEAGTNGTNRNGIRVTWFDEDGMLDTWGPSTTYDNLKGPSDQRYLVAPEGSVAVNLVMWDYEMDNDIYIRNLEHKIENVVETDDGFTTGTCSACGAEISGFVLDYLTPYIRPLPENVCKGVNLWTKVEHIDRYYTGKTEEGDTVYSEQNWSTSLPAIVFPVSGGDRISGFSIKAGIRVAWFLADGSVDSQYRSGDFITAPENAVAVCVPMRGATDAEYYVYIESAEHKGLVDEGDGFMSGICSSCGENVSGFVLEHLNDHVQHLPENYCMGTNLWEKLEPRIGYYRGSDAETQYVEARWGEHGTHPVWSITFPVSEGDQVWASSFTIRITWFLEDGTVMSRSVSSTATAPEGAVAVNIPVWDGTLETGNKVHILSEDHKVEYVDNGDGTETGTCLACGETITRAIAHYLSEIQLLPEDICGGTDLWEAGMLTRQDWYYSPASDTGTYDTSQSKGGLNTGGCNSVTIPIGERARIKATSFGAAPGNGGNTNNGIRVTWFFEDGGYQSVGCLAVYSEYNRSGYITAPSGAVAVNIPMWNNNDSNELYILSLGHYYVGGACIHCGKAPDAPVGGGGGIGTQEPDIAQIFGDRAYSSLQEAIDNYTGTGYIQMLVDAEEVTVDLSARDITLDLGGFDLSLASLAGSETLYVIDTSTDGYGSENIGSITVSKSAASSLAPLTEYEAADVSTKYYVLVEQPVNALAEDDTVTYTANRVAVSVTGMQFAFDSTNAKGYLTYRGTFRGNENTASVLTNFGFEFNENGDVEWFKDDGTAGVTATDLENGYLNFFYTEELSSPCTVDTIAAWMKIREDKQQGTVHEGMQNILSDLKETLLETPGLTDDQIAAINKFFGIEG